MKVLSQTQKASSSAAQVNSYSRILEEIQVTAQRDHPAIVTVLDLGFQEDVTPYDTMRCVKGRDLREIID